MYILTIDGKETEGAYSVTDDEGDQILYLFEEEDDAIRFAMMLEENGSPEMHVIEVEDEIMIKTCENHDYKYVVITPNDIVIPPITENDIV
ncbi:MAG: DUF3110 domain-containing protein [Prochlorococcus sp.]|jgi:hypothetical protein|nr:DUF3110 domain-containing protein [Candidatus Nitrosopelagicus sp.]|tara:strand:- start:382 stop:654 length:273 start_codon:yes stop_codon:yes gene_type:complete